MKDYEIYTEEEQRVLNKRRLEELQLFQYLLRNCKGLNERYHGKALEIADGLQPWIDALTITVERH